MAPVIDEVYAAWRALDGIASGDGWRSIRISSCESSDLHAARWFPGNLEAVFFSFPDTYLPPAETLPASTGFQVIRVDLPNIAGCTLALVRQAAGAADLFADMVIDAMSAVHAVGATGPKFALTMFLRRVRAWQEFMRKGVAHLSVEEEIGLFGELVFIDSLIANDLRPLSAMEAWDGPSRGSHDFLLGTGAIEVKSSVSQNRFLAKISSLDQLDDTLRKPLFISKQRLIQTAAGRTLSEMALFIDTNLNADPEAQEMFRDKLLAAGYLSIHENEYRRRFEVSSSSILPINDSFPRITRGSAPEGIISASYDLDLDQVQSEQITVATVLIELGVK